MSEARIKILIVEDEVLIAKHIEQTLVQNDYSVVGIAHESSEALEMLYNRVPDLVLLDINIVGDLDGIDIAGVINEKYKKPFIFLTAYSDDKTIGRAKKVRPSAYIVKPFHEKDLITNISIAMHNFTLRSKGHTLDKDYCDHLANVPLTEKEFEVLFDLSQGFTNMQIANKQYISLSTVKFHTRNIFNKFDVPNRSQLVVKLLS